MKQGVAKVACKCTHDFQDKTHGSGIRVANTTAKQDASRGTAVVRCTVCKTTHEVPLSKVK